MHLNGQNGYAGCFIWLISLRNSDLQPNQRTPARELRQLHWWKRSGSSWLLLVQKSALQMNCELLPANPCCLTLGTFTWLYHFACIENDKYPSCQVKLSVGLDHQKMFAEFFNRLHCKSILYALIHHIFFQKWSSWWRVKALQDLCQ